MKNIFAFLKSKFCQSPQQKQAKSLYWQIVAQARDPEIFKNFNIPDTLDGRFDSLLLHLFLVIHRLQEVQESEIADHLLRFFTQDMDRSLRETGVGDPSISRKMRKIGEAYMGRMQAYSDAIGDTDKMQQAIHKNVYRQSDSLKADIVSKLTAYVMSYKAMLGHFVPQNPLPKMTETF